MRIVLAIMISLALAPQSATADDDHDLARQALEAGQILPLKDILAKVATAYPGEMIEIELEHEDDVMIYEIKVLTADGRIWKLSYDASNGELLKAKGREKH